MSLKQKKYLVLFLVTIGCLLLNYKDVVYISNYLYRLIVPQENTPSAYVFELPTNVLEKHSTSGNIEGDTIPVPENLISGSFVNVPINFKYPKDWKIYRDDELFENAKGGYIPGASAAVLLQREGNVSMSVRMFFITFNGGGVRIPMTCNLYNYDAGQGVFLKGAVNQFEKNCIYDSPDVIEMNSIVANLPAYTEYDRTPTPSIIPISKDFGLYIETFYSSGFLSPDHGRNLPTIIKLILDSIEVGNIE